MPVATVGSPPTLFIACPLEGPPSVFADCLHEGDETRLRDWIAHDPLLAELLDCARDPRVLEACSVSDRAHNWKVWLDHQLGGWSAECCCGWTTPRASEYKARAVKRAERHVEEAGR